MSPLSGSTRLLLFFVVGCGGAQPATSPTAEVRAAPVEAEASRQLAPMRLLVPNGEVIFVRHADGRVEIEGSAIGTTSDGPLEYRGPDGELRASLTSDGHFQTPSGPMEYRLTERGFIGPVDGGTFELRLGQSGELECYVDAARTDCRNLTSRMEGVEPGNERLAIFTFAIVRLVHEGPL